MKRTFLGVLLAVFAISVSIIGINFNVTRALGYESSGTQVGGIVWENTTWTLENSPYLLTGHVLVAENVKLTVGQGVEIKLNGRFIQVDGILQALGTHERPIRITDSVNTPESKIIFTETSIPWNENAQTGTIVRYTQIEGQTYGDSLVKINGASPKITESNLTNANPSGTVVSIHGGVPSITSCTISGYMGIIVWQGASQILRNVIFGKMLGFSGIQLRALNGTTRIECNKIYQYEIGLAITLGVHPTFVVANNITMNYVGISIWSSGPGESGMLQIFENAIYNNRDWNAKAGLQDVNLTYNWWGTTDTQAIKAKLYDYTQDFRLGRILYEPFLTEPPADLLDDMPPITTHDYDDLWRNTDFIITLTATDDTSGVAETYYRINYGSIKELSIEGQPRITKEGANTTLEYWSVDNAGNEELPYKILTGIKLDKTQPIGFISLSNNATYTISISVTLNLSATDAHSGVYMMRSSNDNTTWTPWESYSISKAWDLTTGDGTKTAYVQFKDNAGLISQSYFDIIVLDTTPPAIQITLPSPDQEKRSYVVTVTWTGSDETSGISHYEVRLDEGSWINVGTSTAHTFSELGDGSHRIDIKATDKAGNIEQDRVNFIVNTSLIGGPGWTDDIIAFSASIIVILIAVAYLFKIRKH